MSRVSVGAVVTILAAFLAGCGGGGGGSTPLTPQAAIQRANSGQAAAVIAEDVDRVMTFYSDGYTGPNGETKADVRVAWEQIFATVDFISHQPIGSTYTVAPSGVAVVEEGSYQFTARNRETGEQGLFMAEGMTNWVKEGNTWRILTEGSGGLVRIAQRKRGN